ncbi:MAG: hypothetical protein A3F54_01960 [Candidatus Kerfeldbacteria bacterium RIFCSPHIGHO2_12_FULL_48_17]|uniref:Uncharacterized protein n=1 Tax=Candidatus Kerfeldbacteria bacterium RIFCSPHIGHO2_12_FULL_48_17 TaxID=1798542 RepID=A0A1G2AZK7_9BACT|nr:MAG: hypothetical protein A3F54_01960 [Candidatus Kerfeldbacteria bacterium RIFCSPHIGHO2_12_FULL_48_17]
MSYEEMGRGDESTNGLQIHLLIRNGPLGNAAEGQKTWKPASASSMQLQTCLVCGLLCSRSSFVTRVAPGGKSVTHRSSSTIGPDQLMAEDFPVGTEAEGWGTITIGAKSRCT